MSLGHTNAPRNEASPAPQRAGLALVRDAAPARDSTPEPSGERDAAARQASDSRGTDAGVGPALVQWKRLCERMESVALDGELSDALGCWLRIGAEPLGATAGVIELSPGAGGETVRVAFGLGERSTNALASTIAGGVIPVPAEVELIADLSESETFGGLLVRPFLDQDGVHALLSAPLRCRMGCSGLLRYCFAERGVRCATPSIVAELLAQRIMALIEHRLLARRAAAAESRLHSVLDGAGASIITVAPDGRIVETNDATAVIFGYGRDELRGMPLSTIFPCAHERILAAKAIDGRAEPRALEFDALRRDGSTFVADVVVGAGALQVGRTLLMRDASARRSAEAHMRQCERLASMGTLVAGLGHDLNNTLLPMRAHVAALSRSDRGRTDGGRSQHWSSLRSGLQHLQALTDSLHFLAADVDARPGAVTDLESWWRDAGPLLAKSLDGRATLETSIEPGLPSVLLDERSLSRVAISLLVNAGEAMPDGRPKELARVLLRARRSACGASVMIEVADNGIGMTEEVRRRAFDAYFTTKMRGIGTGLGLPITRGIIERVGGRIEIDTGERVGTTVRIVLPAESSAAEPGQPPRVACTVRDARLASAIHTALATEGVHELAPDPSSADIWIVSGDMLARAEAERWCASRPASRLMIIGSVPVDLRIAGALQGTTLISEARDLPSITAALSRLVASAIAIESKEE